MDRGTYEARFYFSIASMNLREFIRDFFTRLLNVRDEVDTVGAAERIRGGIWFRGANVWILAFSIVIASVGLNVNSTAVIIGAMLVSPLMGPIVGIGLGLGTMDLDLMKKGGENLVIMVLVSLFASTLYFLISPLQLLNPTEIMARTSPTIYDVLIALFGGFAGILESCRKDRGMALSGVAIATALMPPLCTAGYGLAHGNMNFFMGAMYLFLINGVFIVLATYIMVKNLHFDMVKVDTRKYHHQRAVASLLLLLFLVPSVLSAMRLIRENNFERRVQEFASENQSFTHSYLYDVNSKYDKGRIELFFAGEPLSEYEMNDLLSSAERHGFSREQVIVRDNSFAKLGSEQYGEALKDAYEKTDELLSRKDERIRQLENQLESTRNDTMPYRQVTRELRFKYPDVKDVTIAKGAVVEGDSLSVRERISVVAESGKALGDKTTKDMQDWLRVRLDDTTVVVRNIVVPQAKK